MTEPGWVWLLANWFLLGAGSSLIQTPAGRLLKRSSRPNERSGIFTAQFALSHAWLLVYPVAGWAGTSLDLVEAFAMLAFMALAATIIAFLVWPAENTLEASDWSAR